MNKIDYSPLENAYNAPLKALSKWLNKKRLAVLAVIIAIMIIALSHGYTNTVIGIGTFAFIAVFIQTFRANKDALAAFAAANHWRFDVSRADDIPLSIRGIGEKPKLSNAIVLPLDSTVGRLLTYTYTYGIGDFQTNHYFVILHVQLPKPFPHIVLDSQKNYDGARRLFKNYQKVKLENNFDKYFRVYISQNEQIDALSILTPDLMSDLINNGIKLDLEIKGTDLYFIAPESEANTKVLKYMLESTQPILEELQHKAQTLKYISTNLLEDMELSSRPLVPLTLGGRSKEFLIILGILTVLISVLIIYLVKQTLRVYATH